MRWADGEVDLNAFRDKRLGERLRTMLEQMAGAIGAPIPMACRDWANTKAAYRFLSNGSVNEGEILAGHFQATRARIGTLEGPILVLQDTTEFSYQRRAPEKIGAIGLAPSRRDKNGRLRLHTVCGRLMHSSLAITTEGLPLGLTAAKFWTRTKFKGTNALKRRINPTRVPNEEKESYRWLENMRQSTAMLGESERLVHIGDRENDIYEFFCEAQALGTHFLVRTCVDRLAGDGDHTIADEMSEVSVQGMHRVDIDKDDHADIELRYRRIQVLLPIGKQKRYPSLSLTILHARECRAPEGRPPIDWKLITDLPVTTPAKAIEKLDWYAQRWKIELFHKILKSGCRAEDARLRTADRLVNLIAIFCILSWRIFWMTMINRAAPSASPRLALTDDEIVLIDHLAASRKKVPRVRTLSDYLYEIARLGGYLARAHDPPPDNIVIWRGWTRLMDLKIGANAIRKTYG